MAATAPTLLTPELVRRLVRLADAPGVHGIAVFGSVARGDAGPWSDIDLHAYVGATEPKRQTRVTFDGDRLVMVATGTIEGVREELGQPFGALWAVPALTDMRILVDREGSLAALQAEAAAFRWETMRERAAADVRGVLATSAEYLFKIKGATAAGDEPAALHAAAALRNRCTRALVTARGIFIRTENEYFRKAREAGGERWASLHRAAFATDDAGSLHTPLTGAFAQAAAARRLYAETAALLDELLDAEGREVIARAVALTS